MDKHIKRANSFISCYNLSIYEQQCYNKTIYHNTIVCLLLLACDNVDAILRIASHVFTSDHHKQAILYSTIY